MRSILTIATPSVLALLLLTSCTASESRCQSDRLGQASPVFDLEAARATIARKNAQFTAAHVSGDVAAIDAMFTRDATSLPPGSEAAIGTAALHTLTVEYLKAGIKSFVERTTDMYGAGDLLIDQGEYSVTYGPDNTVEIGKYLNVWKKEDGEWKIHANIWNTNSTPPVSQ